MCDDFNFGNIPKNEERNKQKGFPKARQIRSGSAMITPILPKSNFMQLGEEKGEISGGIHNRWRSTTREMKTGPQTPNPSIQSTRSPRSERQTPGNAGKQRAINMGHISLMNPHNTVLGNKEAEDKVIRLRNLEENLLERALEYNSQGQHERVHSLKQQVDEYIKLQTNKTRRSDLVPGPGPGLCDLNQAAIFRSRQKLFGSRNSEGVSHTQMRSLQENSKFVRFSNRVNEKWEVKKNRMRVLKLIKDRKTPKILQLANPNPNTNSNRGVNYINLNSMEENCILVESPIFPQRRLNSPLLLYSRGLLRQSEGDGWSGSALALNRPRKLLLPSSEGPNPHHNRRQITGSCPSPPISPRSILEQPMSPNNKRDAGMGSTPPLPVDLHSTGKHYPKLGNLLSNQDVGGDPTSPRYIGDRDSLRETKRVPRHSSSIGIIPSNNIYKKKYESEMKSILTSRNDKVLSLNQSKATKSKLIYRQIQDDSSKYYIYIYISG